MDRADAAARFQEQRPHLRAVAYRMLGSVADAEDAVQEAWLRLDRTGTDEIENLAGWLTTVVARICLNMLRSRQSRREDALDLHLPEPVVDPPDGTDPEHAVLLADAVGLALLVVLETLTPAERVAFVLHDIFAVPFEEIAPLVDRTPEAARKLASRARQRVRSAAPAPDADLAAQREVVDAFFAAGRSGNLDGLVAVLHPDVVLRADFGAGRRLDLTGARTVAERARMYADVARTVWPATVNGAAGAVIVTGGRPTSLMAFSVVAGRVAAIDVIADRDRLDRLDLSAVG